MSIEGGELEVELFLEVKGRELNMNDEIRLELAGYPDDEWKRVAKDKCSDG